MEYGFSFPVKDTLEIFGIKIDNDHNKLNFSKHISNVCKKINNQFNVMLPFRKLIRWKILLKLYKAYILPHFYYCPSLWQFCGARDAEELKEKAKTVQKTLEGVYFTSLLLLLLCLALLWSARCG